MYAVRQTEVPTGGMLLEGEHQASWKCGLTPVVITFSVSASSPHRGGSAVKEPGGLVHQHLFSQHLHMLYFFLFLRSDALLRCCL